MKTIARTLFGVLLLATMGATTCNSYNCDHDGETCICTPGDTGTTEVCCLPNPATGNCDVVP